MKREIKILYETERRIEMSGSDQVVDGWCKTCKESVAMLSPAAAATLAGVSMYAAHRWLEAGRFHTLRTASGDLVICRNSLDGYVRKLGVSSKALADFLQGRVLKSGWEAIGLPKEWPFENSDECISSIVESSIVEINGYKIDSREKTNA